MAGQGFATGFGLVCRPGALAGVQIVEDQLTVGGFVGSIELEQALVQAYRKLVVSGHAREAGTVSQSIGEAVLQLSPPGGGPVLVDLNGQELASIAFDGEVEQHRSAAVVACRLEADGLLHVGLEVIDVQSNVRHVREVAARAEADELA
jgi:hypothetical protein